METQFRSNDDLLVVEYYQGAYGPTIHMDARSMRPLLSARDMFLALAHNTCDHVHLHEVAWIKMINIKAFILNRVPEDTEGLRTLYRVQGAATNILLARFRGTPAGHSFTWSREPEGWMECAEKLGRLIEQQTSGHQYLTLEDMDDALVEFAYRENTT